MIGFEYIKNWNFGIGIFFTTFLSFLSFISFLGLGRKLMNLFKLSIDGNWNFCFRLLLGIFSISFIVQILSISKIVDQKVYEIFIMLLSLFGIYELRFLKIKKIKLDRSNSIPILILIIIFSERYIFALLPTTKMDEIAYHMLLPARVLIDNGLEYYSLPWEASILQHMQYQFISIPYYSIGFPEVPNLISLFLFISLIFVILNLIKSNNKDKNIILWSAIFLSCGLGSLVEFTTNASNSLLYFSTTLGVVFLVSVSNEYIKNNLISTTIFFSLLINGMIISKVIMFPIATLFIFIYLTKVFLINKTNFKNSLLPLIIPIFLLSSPIIIFTLINSGSPLGALLSSFFNKDILGNDPLEGAFKGSLGYKGNFKEIIFFMFTKWHPLIWISWFLIPFTRLKKEEKAILLSILIFQLLFIWYFFPDRPRHLAGIQYSAIIFLLLKSPPDLWSKYQKKLKPFLITLVLPWLILDFYFSYPLISKSIINPVLFKNDYIPFYQDFLKIDKLIEDDSQILIMGKRMNAYHSPRKTFMNIDDIKDKKKPTYLFVHGDNQQNINYKFNVEKLVYKNDLSKQYCYRSPNRKCTINILKVYKIILN